MLPVLGEIDVLNMGVAALLSHMEGKKHQEQVVAKTQSPMAAFLQ